MFLKSIRVVFFILCFILFEQNVSAQIITYTFVDPCTKEVTLFSIPVQSGKTTIIFYGKVGNFDANDVSNGTFANWINQSYSDFRKISPCSQKQGQVTQNQITTQIISNTVQSLVSSIMSSSQTQSTNAETSNTSSSSNDAGGKGDSKSNKKKNNNSNNTNGTSTNSSPNQNGGQTQSGSGTNGSDGGTNNPQGGGTTTNGGGSSNSGNSGSSTTQPPVGSGSGSSGNNGGSSGSGSTGGSGSGSGSTGGSGSGSGSTGGSGSGSGSTGGSGSGSSGNSGNNGGSGSTGTTGGSGSGSGSSGNSGNNGGSNSNGTDTKTQKGEEVGTTITMNNDAHNDNGSSGGSGKSGKSGGARSNPIIVSSDITSAQNLNKSYTPIVNIGTSRSSMTGLSSYGVTGMVWLNFEQFALSARYTKIHFNKSKKLKFVHNVNLTGVYTYGNFLGFVGYSGILNGGKYGITGFNVSAAATVIATDKSGYYSPSITAFYTRPIKVNKKLIISPEIYIISTPLVYSTKEKVTVSDRYFSGFVGSGVDYQISKRFKVNVNYKANLSTNPQFPILSFFLIGSKVNL